VFPEVTLSLALYDYLPILIWIAGSFFLIDTLKGGSKGIFFYILILSLALVCVGGTLKATWKLLIALTGSNLPLLSDIQFPLMGAGFFLLFLSLLSFLVQHKDIQGEKFAAAVLLKKIFLPLMIVGSVGSTVCLIIVAKRSKAYPSLIFYTLFLIVSTAMGYVGSRITAEHYQMILLEQTINCASTLLWALGSYFLWRAHRRFVSPDTRIEVKS